MLSDIISAYETACTDLSYVFKFGTLSNNINIPSVAKGKFIWVDRPVNGGLDAKLIKTGTGKIRYNIVIHSLEEYTQQKEAEQTKQAIYDDHTTRLINVLSEAHSNDLSLQKGIAQNDSSNIFQLKVHQGKYIGVLANLTYNLDYCNG